MIEIFTDSHSGPIACFLHETKVSKSSPRFRHIEQQAEQFRFFSQILWKGLLPIACGIFWRTSSKTKCQESDQLLCLCWNLPQMMFGISLSETKHKWLYQTSPQILDVNSWWYILLMMEGVSPRKVERVDLVRWMGEVFHATGSTRAHYYWSIEQNIIIFVIIAVLTYLIVIISLSFAPMG